MDERLRFVQDVHRPGWSIAELCRRYEVSRKTGYKWLRAYERGGPAALADGSHRPQTSPQATAPKVVRLILEVEVTDTGIGVKETDLEHIFGHFVSSKPKGLGMGLAISRSIIKAHRGRIWASANTGGGLTVHIELPCSPRAAPETPPSAPAIDDSH